MNAKASLAIVALFAAILWRAEVEIRGWAGLSWISYLHIAVVAGLAVFLTWVWVVTKNLTRKRRAAFISVLLLVFLVLYAPFDFVTRAYFEGHVQTMQLALPWVWFLLPVAIFCIYRLFVKLRWSACLVGCGCFWLSWLIALAVLYVLPEKGTVDLIHTLKTGWIIPPLIFGLGYPLAHAHDLVEAGGKEAKKRDWFTFWVHFVFGAGLGGLLGIAVWGRPQFHIYDSMSAGILCIGGGALLGGILAGLGGENFWDDLLN